MTMNAPKAKPVALTSPVDEYPMKKMTFLLTVWALSGCMSDPNPGSDPGLTDPAAPDAVASQDGARGAGDGTVIADPSADADPASVTDGPTDPPPTEDANPPSPEVDANAPAPSPDAAAPEMDATPEPEAPFSFFVTSLEAMRELSGSEDGFGGDLGGLAGADAICQTIADGVGVGHKEWRAFLSVVNGPDGEPVHAIDRIGEGPWYDANHRLVSQDIAGLLNERPDGDPQSVNDLPTEFGQPLTVYGDAHDIPTGSDRTGRLNSDDPEATCNDWTSAESIGQDMVVCGHSFPRRGGRRRGAQWISDHQLRGCTPGVNLLQNGRGVGDCIGCSGGYGGIYCFALSP